jgi:hypothetical protein
MCARESRAAEKGSAGKDLSEGSAPYFIGTILAQNGKEQITKFSGHRTYSNTVVFSSFAKPLVVVLKLGI